MSREFSDVLNLARDKAYAADSSALVGFNIEGMVVIHVQPSGAEQAEAYSY